MIMKFFYYFLLALITVISGCKTNPPQIVEPPVTLYGKVFVTTSVEGASIFVDNVNTGKLTPDTVTAAVGSHTVRVDKDGYVSFSWDITVLENLTVSVDATLEPMNAQKVVLLEDFANVSCDPCVISNRIIESISKVYFGKSKLAVIKFATSWPSPVDPFYLANKPDAQSRWGSSFYNLINAPTVIVDGILRPTPSDSNDVKSKVQSRLDIPAKFNIEVNDSLSGDNYIIKVKINVYDIAGLNLQNLVLHTVITETDIEFTTPPGSNGETKFYNVMRKMLPANTGEVLGTITPGSVLNFQREFALSTSWLKPNIHTVAFIQDKVTKEVYQAGSTN